jgi:hypothetical protein
LNCSGFLRTCFASRHGIPAFRPKETRCPTTRTSVREAHVSASNAVVVTEFRASKGPGRQTAARRSPRQGEDAAILPKLE